jgi:hypothetical protein
MISKDDVKLSTYTKVIAAKMYEMQDCPPAELISSLFTYSKVDGVCGFIYNVSRILISNYLNELSKEFNIKFLSNRLAETPSIKNASIYEYKYSIRDSEFYACALIRGDYCISSNHVLSDALVSSRIKHGCFYCKYSADGCELCGFNKIKNILNKMEDIQNFDKTSKVFYDIVGDKVKPIQTFIDMMIEHEKACDHDAEKLGTFKPTHKN